MFGEKISFTDSAKSSKKEDQFTEYCIAKSLNVGKLSKNEDQSRNLVQSLL